MLRTLCGPRGLRDFGRPPGGEDDDDAEGCDPQLRHFAELWQELTLRQF